MSDRDYKKILGLYDNCREKCCLLYVEFYLFSTCAPPPPLLPSDLENDFQFDRGTERKACDAID